MILVDANVVLRYLLKDIADQADQAKSIIAENQVNVLLGVLAEVVYVLSGVYEVPRKEIADILIGFGNLDNVIYEQESIAFRALTAFSDNNIDFIDGILYSYHVLGVAEIMSFDKKLNTLLLGNR